MKTFLEIRQEIGVYNNRLNHFIKVFDLEIFNLKYLFDCRISELRDYHEVKDELYELLLAMKDLILAFSKDYYSWKSVRYIAETIEIEPAQVVLFLSEEKRELFEYEYSFPSIVYNTDEKNLNNDLLFSMDTKIKNISSFQILKNIQNKIRIQKLKDCIEKTKLKL